MTTSLLGTRPSTCSGPTQALGLGRHLSQGKRPQMIEDITGSPTWSLEFITLQYQHLLGSADCCNRPTRQEFLLSRRNESSTLRFPRPSIQVSTIWRRHHSS